MFVQVVQGRVSDATQVRQGLDDWMARLAPDAEGWLGPTTGVTDDGTSIAIVRFDSAEAARRNSDRAQQGEWWSGMSKLFTGEVTVHDCSEVVPPAPGAPTTLGPARAPAGRSNRATTATRRDHVRPTITAGQRPRPDFWHPTGHDDRLTDGYQPDPVLAGLHEAATTEQR
jgi:hypothetical protein